MKREVKGRTMTLMVRNRCDRPQGKCRWLEDPKGHRRDDMRCQYRLEWKLALGLLS
jgi:hypothetical protein